MFKKLATTAVLLLALTACGGPSVGVVTHKIHTEPDSYMVHIQNENTGGRNKFRVSEERFEEIQVGQSIEF